jgi:hypothetical protein
MRKRLTSSVLLLATLGFSLIVGDVLVLTAKDPQNPAPAKQQTPQTQPQTPETQTPTTKKTPAQTTTPAQTANLAAEQTDLSGTYIGTFNCDALGLTGDTTLTITGNQFTTADGRTGRIVATTTGGYTAVALQVGDTGAGTMAVAGTIPATGATTTTATTAPAGATTAATGTTVGATATPTIVSMRARRSGDRLTLTPAAGSTMRCSFTPTRGPARRRTRQRTPAATGTEVSNPTAMPDPTSNPTTPTQPTTPEQPIPAQTPSPTPMPSPTPSGSPTPMPSPTPSGSPTPEPSPTASPTPSPSPSPSPGRPRG